MVIKIKHLIQLRIIEYIYKWAQIAVAQGTAIPEVVVVVCQVFCCLFFHSLIYKSLRSNKWCDIWANFLILLSLQASQIAAAQVAQAAAHAGGSGPGGPGGPSGGHRSPKVTMATSYFSNSPQVSESSAAGSSLYPPPPQPPSARPVAIIRSSGMYSVSCPQFLSLKELSW